MSRRAIGWPAAATAGRPGRRAVLRTALLAAALAACEPSPQAVADGPDAQRALRVAARSTRYTVQYWEREARQGTAQWDSALAFCRGVWGADRAPEHPTCGAVRAAEMTTDAARTRVRTTDQRVETIGVGGGLPPAPPPAPAAP